MADSHYLVTGALGCIGAWVVRNLVQAGIRTTIYDLGTSLHRLQLILSEAELAAVRTAERGDVTDLEALKKAITDNGVTHIIHLAALQVPFCRANPPLGAAVNVVGTVNVFEAARHAGINRVVYASSFAVYGSGDEYPPGLIANNAPTDPQNLYGVYKLANEGTARIYYAENGISSIAFRPYTVYGPGRDQGMTSVPTVAMYNAAHGEGTHIPFGGVIAYQHADDVAKLFVKAATVPFEGAGVFNLKGEIAHMSEVVAYIEDAAPEVKGKITFDDVPFALPEGADDSELVALMGSVPNRPLREGIAQTVDHFRKAAGL